MAKPCPFAIQFNFFSADFFFLFNVEALGQKHPLFKKKKEKLLRRVFPENVTERAVLKGNSRA